MEQKIKISLLLLILHVGNNACYGEIFVDEDKPYEPIVIKIPTSVWKQAMNPSPVLKAAATVTIPIQVNEEYTDPVDADDNEDIDDVEVVTQIEVIDPITDAPIVQNEVVASNQPTSVASTQAPVQTPAVTEADEQQPVIFGQGLRFPCSCYQGQCGCCSNMNVQWLRMSTCGNISFVPEDFVFDVRLSVNNNTVIRRRVSASDPPPICFNPRRVPFVRVCLEISNIRIRNRNAFACLDLTADIAEFPIYTASFRCFGLGSSGVQTGLKPKPVSSGPKPVDLFAGANNEEGSSLVETAASAVIGGTSNGDGLLGGVSGGILFGDGGGADAEGPLDAIGDAIEGFFE